MLRRWLRKFFKLRPRVSDRVKKIEAMEDDIRETHAGDNWSGELPCPLCGGTLSASHVVVDRTAWSFVHLYCKTPGCVSR